MKKKTRTIYVSSQQCLKMLCHKIMLYHFKKINMLVNTNTKIFNSMQQGKTGEHIQGKNNNQYADEQTNNQSYVFQKQN